MTDIIVETIEGELYTLIELCECSRLQEGFIVACIEHGVVEVRGMEPAQWRFTSQARLQVQKAWRLHQDLDLQLAALPLVLDLLDEVDKLRHETRFLRQRLSHWEPRG